MTDPRPLNHALDELSRVSAAGTSSSGASPEHATTSVGLTPEVLLVLDQALDDLANLNRQPTASQVRLAMRRITYDGFDPIAFGFKRFRDFLQAAANANRIELVDRPGDVLVTRPSTATSSDFVRIRRDLWKAALDWSADVSHYLDLNTDKTLTIPAVPVPLEPEKFALVRRRVAEQDETLVRIPSIDIRTQTGWMEQFARSLGDLDVRFILLEALCTAKPARDFADALRADSDIRAAWNRSLSANVFAHLVRWRSDDPRLASLRIEANQVADLSPVRSEAVLGAGVMPGASTSAEAGTSIARPEDRPVGNEPTAAGSSSPNGEMNDRAASRTPMGKDIVSLSSAGRWSVRRGSPWSSGRAGGVNRIGAGSDPGNRRDRHASLRLALHRAIDRMSEDELARLPIPIGYLIDD